MLKRRSRSVASEITVLRHTLRTLDRSLRTLSPILAVSPTGRASSQAKEVRRSLRLSAKARAALKLQGRYMGYMRQLKRDQKAMVKNLRASKGVRAAIVSARKMLRRKRAA